MELTSTLLCSNRVQERVCLHFLILFGTISNAEDTLDEFESTMFRVFIVSGNYYLLLLTAALPCGWIVG